MPGRTCSPWPTAWVATPAVTSPRSTVIGALVDARRRGARAARGEPGPAAADLGRQRRARRDGQGRARACTAWAPRSSPSCAPATSSSWPTSATPAPSSLRDGKLTQITKDHSFVQSLVDEGRITEDEAIGPPAALPRHPGPHRPGRRRARRDRCARPRIGDRYLICLRRPHRLRRRRHHRRASPRRRRPRAPPPTASSSSPSRPAPPTTSPSSSATSSTSPRSPRRPTQPQIVGRRAPRAPRAAPAPIPVTPGRQGRRPVPRGRRRRATTTTTSTLAEEGPRLGRGSMAAPRRRARWSCSSSSAAARMPRTPGPSASTSSARHDGNVAIYQGVSQNIGPVSLSHVESKSDIPVDDLPDFYRAKVEDGVSTDTPAQDAARAGEPAAHRGAALRRQPDHGRCLRRPRRPRHPVDDDRRPRPHRPRRPPLRRRRRPPTPSTPTMTPTR